MTIHNQIVSFTFPSISPALELFLKYWKDYKKYFQAKRVQSDLIKKQALWSNREVLS